MQHQSLYLRSLGILEAVLKLPDGLNTHLSGGQSPFSNGELRAL
jgi:ABC-type multidrug transport system fused ATPase/permease subunit